MPLDEGGVHAIQASHANDVLNTFAGAQLQSAIPGQKPVLVHPKDFSVTSLESYLPGRSRYRGVMKTNLVADFATYVRQFCKTDDEICFVDAQSMSATAIFNLGSLDFPGHADFKAVVGLEKTGSFKTLLEVTDSHQLRSQRKMAEWMEDHRQKITFFDGEGGVIHAMRAIGSVRKMTIESARSVSSEENSFSSNKTAMESLEAKAEDIPHFIRYKCKPYHGLKEYDILCRVGLSTGGDSPAFSLSIIDEEGLEEEFSDEFVALLEDALVETEMRFIRGTFTP